jgi:hypothetical protein
MIAACGAGTASLFFLTMRGMRLPALVAALFTGVLLASATYLHWFAVIETYAPAAFSVVAMLFLLVSGPTGRPGPWVAGSTAVLAITVTNWILALLASVVRLGVSRALRISAAALLLAAGLSVLQKAVYPTAGLFFNPLSIAREVRYTQVYAELAGTGSWTAAANARSFVLTSAVAPPPALARTTDPVPLRQASGGRVTREIVGNQATPPSAYGALGMVAVASWITLVLVGVLGACLHRERRAVAAATGMYLLSQLCLHLVYGEITFLYSAHFFPAMVLLAAFGWHTPARSVAVAAAVVFVVAGGISNWTQLQAAADLVNLLLGRPA